eukprot:s1590_g3.t1
MRLQAKAVEGLRCDISGELRSLGVPELITHLREFCKFCEEELAELETILLSSARAVPFREEATDTDKASAGPVEKIGIPSWTPPAAEPVASESGEAPFFISVVGQRRVLQPAVISAPPLFPFDFEVTQSTVVGLVTGYALYIPGRGRLKTINCPEADDLREVTSVEDCRKEAYSALIADPVSNTVRFKRGKAMTTPPSSPEELRLRHRRIGLAWEMAKSRHTNRVWLPERCVDAFRKLSDHVLGSKIAGRLMCARPAPKGLARGTAKMLPSNSVEAAQWPEGKQICFAFNKKKGFRVTIKYLARYACGGVFLQAGSMFLSIHWSGCHKDPNLSDARAAATSPAPCEPKRDIAESDVSSDEDEDGQPKAKLVSGHWGHGPPLTSTLLGKRNPFADGFALCSPGRWAPATRRSAADTPAL